MHKRPVLWMFRTLGWTTLLVSSWLSLAVDAQVLPDDGKQAIRDTFEALEKKIRKTPDSKLSGLDDELSALQDYPLYPYLERQILYRHLNLAHRAEIEQFLSAYAGQPVSYGLRGAWLRYLADKNAKAAFLSNYRDGMGATLTCQYLSYQLEQAANPKYWLEKVAPIWLSGQSQPDECDPIFRQWEKAGMMTEDMILGRIERAASKGNPRLVPYLKSKLSPAARYLADLWISVRNDPAYVLNFSKFPLRKHTYESAILAYGLERLAWSDADKAALAYQHWQPKKIFSRRDTVSMLRALALSKAIDNAPDARQWLQMADVPDAAQDVKRWHLALLLRHQQWKPVLTLISQASEKQQQQDNFVYWRARALEALGHHKQAHELYSQLAGQRHYYGFMASAKVGQTPNLAHTPTPLSQPLMDEVATHPAARRAFEFLHMGRNFEARREWYYLINHIDTARIKDAALLANQWGWYDQSIMSFARSGFMDDVEKRFPLAYASEFSVMGETYNVKPAFAMAIARRESTFRSDAISPAGAAGLMQLMPGTARYLAQKKLSRDTLFEPEQNLQFGVQYLRYLANKLGDNPVLISASYNAGWRKVLQWLPEDADQPTDVWIENIPYKETRHYVKAVMAYRYIYEHQLSGPSELFQQLAESAIPSSQRISDQGQSLQLAPD